MIKNLSIRGKLLVGFMLVALIALVIGMWNLVSLREIEDKKTDLLSSYETADAIMESKFYLKSEAQLFMEILAAENFDEIEEFWSSHLENQKRIGEELPNAISLLESESWGHEYSEDKLVHHEEIEAIKLMYDEKVLPLFTEMVDLLKTTNNRDAVQEKLNLFDVDFDEYISKAVEVLDEIEYEMEETIVTTAKESTEATISRAIKMSIVFVIAGIIIAVLLSMFISNALVKPIQGMMSVVHNLSEGRLNHSFKYGSKDEIGQMAASIKNMTEKLNNIVSGIVTGADNIASASNQISTGAQTISQGANESAASVEEISSSMEEMAANIQQNSDNAQETERIASQSSVAISKGNDSVQVAVHSMQQIAEKIGIVNDIAFQTNILALNAAVEAARAGEHGKGFAVVAAEVRKLAERSKNAAQEIDDLSNNGVNISQEAGENLELIVPEIKKTANLVLEITASSTEQSSGANQINNAIQQLSHVAQQNASSSEELATSAEELTGQAEQLKDLVSFFSK